MIHWFIRFPEFDKITKFPLHLGELKCFSFLCKEAKTHFYRKNDSYTKYVVIHCFFHFFIFFFLGKYDKDTMQMIGDAFTKRLRRRKVQKRWKGKFAWISKGYKHHS